jgi:hypothetical protein
VSGGTWANCCEQCGAPLGANTQFCSSCGAPVSSKAQTQDNGLRQVITSRSPDRVPEDLKRRVDQALASPGVWPPSRRALAISGVAAIALVVGLVLAFVLPGS